MEVFRGKRFDKIYKRTEVALVFRGYSETSWLFDLMLFAFNKHSDIGN